MGWKTVHNNGLFGQVHLIVRLRHDAVRLGLLYERHVHLERGEGLHPHLRLLLHTGADPDVSVDDVSPGDALSRVMRDLNCSSGVFLDLRQYLGAGAVLGVIRADHGHVHPDAAAAYHGGVRGVASPVPHVGDLEPLQLPLVLLDGEEVGEVLAGVIGLGHPVDNGNGGSRTDPLHGLLAKGPDHDGVHVLVQVLHAILQGLAPGELAPLYAVENRVAPQAVHPGLEADPGPQGRQLEEHYQRLVLHGVAVFPGVRLDLGGEVQYLVDLVLGQVEIC